MANYNEKIIFGLDQIHVSKVAADGSFGVPIAILGARTVEASFESSTKEVGADNNDAVYVDSRVSKGSGKLGVLGLTTTEKCLLAGGENMSGGFALSSKTTAPTLAVLFAQDKADGGKILSVIYNVKFSIPGISAITTNGEIEEQIVELDFTCYGEGVTGKSYYYNAVDTKDASADATMVSNWFTAVQMPKETVAPTGAMATKVTK